MDRRPLLTVFLVGIVSLAYELVQVRMLSFFLGNGMDFLAIPIALLGLAMGSMACHFLYKGSLDRLVSVLSASVLPLICAVFLGLFALANAVFEDIHAGQTDPVVHGVRVAAYGLVFLPPYVVFGALLAAAFSRGSERIGQLYFYDLAGAGLGCTLIPLMLAWTDLWPTLVGVLGLALALLAVDPLRKPRTVIVAAAGFLTVAVLAWQGLVFREHPDLFVLTRWGLGEARKGGVSELAVRWNPIARTALVKANPDGPYAIIQDNGISNVTVQSWQRDRTREEAAAAARHHGLAWKLGKDPKKMLVIFAGAGRDLIMLDSLAGGDAEVTGVEINPTVVDYATGHPVLKRMGVAEFLSQPGKQLVNKEGRHFLDNDTGRYDLIYVANNGAPSANRTGHTRKFLDTCEAMGEYLDHLEPGGMLVFVSQPINEKLQCFRVLFEERGLGDAANAMFAWGWPDLWMLDSLVVAPAGLSEADVATLRAEIRSWKANAQILYDPSGSGLDRTVRLVKDPIDPDALVTDDRPFTQPIVLSEFELFPSRERLSDPMYLASWTKVFTVGLFAMVSGLVALVAGLAGGRTGQVPWPWVAYLLSSGVGFMCVEIPLIARTELFVGNPLYAVALNLALFLVASACGAMLQDRYRTRSGPLVLVSVAVIGVLWGLAGSELLDRWLLWSPLPVKAVALAVVVFPVGMGLGAFYPYAVDRLVREGRPSTVPMSYCLSTLSSVLGSSFAMTAMIDLGFTRVIALGAALYVLAGAIALARRS